MPGLTLNLSKRGASVSVGARGAHLTVGTSGIRETVGLPGTGLFYTATQGRHGPRRRTKVNQAAAVVGAPATSVAAPVTLVDGQAKAPISFAVVCVIVMLGAVIIGLLSAVLKPV